MPYPNNQYWLTGYVMAALPQLHLINRTPPPDGMKGWSATDLKVGRVWVGEVHVYDAEGAYHFREFMDAILGGTRRLRPGRNATRYLEHLPASSPARLLSKEAADYIKDMKRRGLGHSSEVNFAHFARLLQVATGDIPVSRITAEHITEFWEVVRWWPKNAGSFSKYRGMSDRELYEFGKQSNREPPAFATMELAQRVITAFFTQLKDNGTIGFSPMAGVRPMKKPIQEENVRRGFTDEELAEVLDPCTFVPWASKAPHKWWGPIIGVFTGARVNEVAQLKISDICQQDGMWCIKIRVTPNRNGTTTQQLKGQSSKRTIPLPQGLIDLGFLDFLQDAKACGHERLFPHLKRGVKKGTSIANGDTYGAALCRQFSDHLRRHHDLEKGMAFHCFRHNIVNRLMDKDVDVAVVAAITGHHAESEQEENDFKVLRERYRERKKSRKTKPSCQERLWALNSYPPVVKLPRYQAGQFEHCYAQGVILHP